MESLEIDGYSDYKYIGSGILGQVFEAKNETLDRKEAIKKLYWEPTQFNLLRFVAEAQRIAGLLHPNICTVYRMDYIQDNDKIIPYQTMELVDGYPLSQSQQLLNTWPLSTRLIRFIDLTSAVAYAHMQGVIHGDIHANNVMISGDGHIKVIDFGLSSLLLNRRRGWKDDLEDLQGLFMKYFLVPYVASIADDIESEQFSVYGLIVKISTWMSFRNYPLIADRSVKPEGDWETLGEDGIKHYNREYWDSLKNYGSMRMYSPQRILDRILAIFHRFYDLRTSIWMSFSSYATSYKIDYDHEQRSFLESLTTFATSYKVDYDYEQRSFLESLANFAASHFTTPYKVDYDHERQSALLTLSEKDKSDPHLPGYLLDKIIDIYIHEHAKLISNSVRDIVVEPQKRKLVTILISMIQAKLAFIRLLSLVDDLLIVADPETQLPVDIRKRWTSFAKDNTDIEHILNNLQDVGLVTKEKSTVTSNTFTSYLVKSTVNERQRLELLLQDIFSELIEGLPIEIRIDNLYSLIPSRLQSFSLDIYHQLSDRQKELLHVCTEFELAARAPFDQSFKLFDIELRGRVGVGNLAYIGEKIYKMVDSDALRAQAPREFHMQPRIRYLYNRLLSEYQTFLLENIERGNIFFAIHSADNKKAGLLAINPIGYTSLEDWLNRHLQIVIDRIGKLTGMDPRTE